MTGASNPAADAPGAPGAPDTDATDATDVPGGRARGSSGPDESIEPDEVLPATHHLDGHEGPRGTTAHDRSAVGDGGAGGPVGVGVGAGDGQGGQGGHHAHDDLEGQAAPPAERESIGQPAKVMRIGSMVKQLLDEVRQAPLDEAGRARLREIYDQSVAELATGLSPDLVAELDRMRLPFDEGTPTEAELRIAQAQLVGWLEGLFHGIQATLMAQQMAARAQLDEMRQRGLPAGPDNGARPTRTGYL